MAEFLILGGILAFGYQITQNNNNEPLIDEEATQSNVLSVDVPMNNVLENQQIMSHRQLQDNFELNVRQHMNRDDVVTNYNQPFFKSGRSQNTNEYYKDTKLGIFTGVENLDFQKKEVPTNTFSPTVDSGRPIHGNIFQPDMERYKNYVAHANHNNVTPIEKQYIGPGLGIPIDQPAAGGFHQNFRIRPDNVNVYRKNNLSSLPVQGSKTLIDKPAQSPNIESTKGLTAEEFTTIGDRGFDNARFVSDAPTVRSVHDENLKVQNRMINNKDLTGNAAFSAGSYIHGSDRLNKDTTNPLCNLPVGIANGVSYGNGGYTTEQYVMAANDNRDIAQCDLINLQSTNAGTYFNNEQALNPTLRGQCNEQVTNATSIHGGQHDNYRDSHWSSRPTQKEQTVCNEYSGVAYGGMNATTVYDDPNTIRATQRGAGSIYNNDSGFVSEGPRGHFVPGSGSYRSAYTGSDANTYSREMSLVSNYTPNGGTQTHDKMIGAHDFKSDSSNNTIQSNPKAQGVNNFANSCNMGSTLVPTNRVEENKRDWGYHQEVVKNNPYIIDITKPQQNKFGMN